MLVEYYCRDKKKSVEIDNNKTKAKERKNEFILYTYLEKSPVENKDGEKMIAPSARDFYMASMESFFEEAKEQGLITSQETINPFNIDNVEFLNDILYNLQKDDKYKVVATSKSRNNRTTAFRHLLDFVENFEVPQIFLLSINPEKDDYWKDRYPLEQWQLGKNNDMIYYGENYNILESDIGLFYVVQEKAVCYIGRAYKKNGDNTYFEIILEIKNGFTLSQIREIQGLQNPPLYQGCSKFSNQQAGLELAIKCFENGEIGQGQKIIQKQKEQTMSNNSNENSNKNPPLNQILYGPPGTGKTYNTINKALEILGYGMQDNEKSKITLDYDKIKQKLQEIAKSEDAKALNLENLDSKSDRELAKLLFDYYCNTKQGQIAFVTFHQSFSYEEFVEGIKPIFVDENGEEVKHSKNMIYKAKNGIFKDICERAKQYTKEFIISQQVKKPYVLDKSKTLWRLYTLPDAKIDNDFFDECIKDGCVKAYYDYGGVALSEKAQNGDYVVIPSTNYGEMSKTIRAFGILGSDRQTNVEKEYCKDVEWLWVADDENKIIRFDKVNFNRPTFQRVIQGKETIIDYMNTLMSKDKTKFETQPHILIIDEINRGNISKILGELITLIEPSKRIGASNEEKARSIGNESLEVTLPYSNESFGVPSNLYIIGTMNTADRSIALLDTALRRRFEFVEMMPEPELLEIIKVENGEINLQMLLEKMNARIEFLLDREHTIGHSFFINVNSLSELQQVFKNKIIPLLQEYFYDDYAKIDAVLNGNGMIKLKKDSTLEKLFDTNFKSDLDSEKVVYQIINSNKWNEKNFLRIYDSSVQIDKDE